MDKKEIEELQKEFWKDSFNKYATEPNENGFKFNYSKMMVDFVEHCIYINSQGLCKNCTEVTNSFLIKACYDCGSVKKSYKK